MTKISASSLAFPRLLLFLLLWLLLLVPFFAIMAENNGFDKCYSDLDRNDVNLDKKIDLNEYLDFIQDFGNRTECLSQLQEELPQELLIVWDQLSCECAVRGGNFNCCSNDNAHIPITGVLPDNPTNIEEQQFLQRVCLQTDQAVIAFCGLPPPPAISPPPPGFSVPTVSPSVDDGEISESPSADDGEISESPSVDDGEIISESPSADGGALPCLGCSGVWWISALMIGLVVDAILA